MALKYQKRDKLLELFFEQPNKKFTVREVSRKAGLPTSTAQRYLKQLRKDGIITKGNKAVITPHFKFKKAIHIIDRLYQTGLVNFLEATFRPSAIVIFGSARKGEYEQESDVDIFVESAKPGTPANLTPFEKRLGHKLQLFIEKSVNDLPQKLRNSVVNGIKLSGYLNIRWQT